MIESAYVPVPAIVERIIFATKKITCYCEVCDHADCDNCLDCVTVEEVVEEA